MAPWTMPSVTFAKRDNSPAMPIRQFLNGERFDPETTRILGVAFEAARIALRFADRGDAFPPIVAKRIIELAKTVTFSSSDNRQHAVTFAPITSLLVIDDIGV